MLGRRILDPGENLDQASLARWMESDGSGRRREERGEERGRRVGGAHQPLCDGKRKGITRWCCAIHQHPLMML